MVRLDWCHRGVNRFAIYTAAVLFRSTSDIGRWCCGGIVLSKYSTDQRYEFAVRAATSIF